MYLLVTGLKGTSILKLHRDLSVTQKTVWHLVHRIREGMRVDDFLSGTFSRPVEADETYVGRLEKNERGNKRMAAAGGLSGKAIVAGVKDRKTKQVSAGVVADNTAATLVGMVREHAEPGAQVFTDEAKGYLPLSRHGYSHQAVKHSVSEWMDEQAHTNGMESFLAMLKRGYHGTYHQISHEHLGRYVAEFSHRHNQRPEDAIDQIASAFSLMEGRQLLFRTLVADGMRADVR